MVLQKQKDVSGRTVLRISYLVWLWQNVNRGAENGLSLLGFIPCVADFIRIIDDYRTGYNFASQKKDFRSES